MILAAKICRLPPFPLTLKDKNVQYSLFKYTLFALQNTSRLDWFQQQNFLLNGRFQPVFAEVLTFKGFVYSFNLLDADELFNLEG